MITPGSRCSRIAAARPIAAEESLPSLSRTTFLSSSFGSCSSTAARWARPQTTITRPSPAIGASRSQVSLSRVCPDPVRSWRNFGASARESGQSREPIPPAGITA